MVDDEYPFVVACEGDAEEMHVFRVKRACNALLTVIVSAARH